MTLDREINKLLLEVTDDIENIIDEVDDIYDNMVNIFIGFIESDSKFLPRELANIMLSSEKDKFLTEKKRFAEICGIMIVDEIRKQKIMKVIDIIEKIIDNKTY